MKAIINTIYGSPDVLELKEIDKPTPKDDDVLVKIHAVSLNAADWHLLRGDPFLIRFEYGLQKPKNTILGADVAGTIEAIGKDVKSFKVGDAVYGDLSSSGFGGLAEYVAAPEISFALKPKNLSFEQAAAVPMAALTALQGLRDLGQIKAGQKVLINGASGGVGTFAVQIAKAFGAEVTAVCSSKKIEMVRSIGADHVIDYTKVDFTKNGQHYELILAANGNRSIFDYKRALSPNGKYVMTGGSLSQIFQAILLGPLISMAGTQKMSNLLARPSQSDLVFMNGLLETCKVVPVIDKTYQLSEAPEAMRYLENGHAAGKVVIMVESHNEAL